MRKRKISALESGADDYVTKPFGVGELIARLHVSMRHAQKPDDELPEFRNGDLFVDIVNRIVKKGDNRVSLTSTEYSILMQFVKNAGKVLTHRLLIKEIWALIGPTRPKPCVCIWPNYVKNSKPTPPNRGFLSPNRE